MEKRGIVDAENTPPEETPAEQIRKLSGVQVPSGQDLSDHLTKRAADEAARRNRTE